MVMHSGMKFIVESLADEVGVSVRYLVYKLLNYSSKYATVDQLFEEAVPISHDLFESKADS